MRVIAAAKVGLKIIVGLIVAFLVLMMINDGSAEYGDVSHEPERFAWVGRRCTVLKGLMAHGVTLHPGPNEITDYVSIGTQGIGGREITFQVPIQKGTEMVISGIERCTNCRLFAFGRIRYAVAVIPNLRELAPYRVFANSYAMEPDQVHCAKSVSPAH